MTIMVELKLIIDLKIEEDEINFNIKLECSAKFFSKKLFLVEKENNLYFTSFQMIDQEILEYRIFGVFLEDDFKITFLNYFEENHDNNSLEIIFSSLYFSNWTIGKTSLK